MDQRKKNMDIVGFPIIPIAVGYAAWINEGDNARRTSRVLSMEEISHTEIRFETENTNYHLRILKPDSIRQEVNVG